MVEETISSESLLAAFRRLRGHWNGLSESRPRSEDERASILSEVTEDLPVISATARISANTVPYVEMICRMRLGELGVDSGAIPQGLAEMIPHLRSGFETLIRALQQMESGEDILSESGQDMRRNAARTVGFLLAVRELGGAGQPASPDSQDSPRPRESREEKIQRLVQSYDGRRKQIREEVEVEPEAIEAVEFLLRLGAT